MPQPSAWAARSAPACSDSHTSRAVVSGTTAMTCGCVDRQDAIMQHINDAVSIPNPRTVAEDTMIPHLLCGTYSTASQESIVIAIVHGELLCLTRAQFIPN